MDARESLYEYGSRELQIKSQFQCRGVSTIQNVYSIRTQKRNCRRLAHVSCTIIVYLASGDENEVANDQSHDIQYQYRAQNIIVGGRLRRNQLNL